LALAGWPVWAAVSRSTCKCVLSLAMLQHMLQGHNSLTSLCHCRQARSDARS
jgi:hypothetical protein